MREGKREEYRNTMGLGFLSVDFRALSPFNTLACDCHYRKGFTMCEWRKCCKLLSLTLFYSLILTEREMERERGKIVISIPAQ